MLGAVVVGVGLAGCVRIRDMSAPPAGSPAPTMQVRGFISRRSLGPQHGVSQMSQEEALSREDVEVAFICTENVLHKDSVRYVCQRCGEGHQVQRLWTL
ncbi:Biliverdin reductase A [Liparis tanakae]|uniref:Biliverdin reductase A n=1 Tax=Liparis tanakae TaxID=230148 RepID=A0A4Z2EZ74_9TELE|nr:Biliverdin reductase A [Liparis tanakae]